VPSIINGLFSGRSGIASHGTAIGVIGDNISNASTIGFKASRAEFADLIAGGQTSGKVIGSGSTTSAISTIFEQGTLEFTNRPLDLAIDGNGYFVVTDNGSRYYTRAGNFKTDASGYLIDQNGFQVLGFPSGGSGALESLNLNTVAQDTVLTGAVTFAGNVDAASTILSGGTSDIPTVTVAGASGTPSTTTYAELNEVATFSTVVEVFDSLGVSHTVTTFFFHTDQNEFTARSYVNSDDVDASSPASGLPRLLGPTSGTGAGSVTLVFDSDGSLNSSSASEIAATDIQWNNGADQEQDIDFDFSNFTQFAAGSNIQSITQDGQGIGAVTSVSIEKDGRIFALLSNGQSSVIGVVGLVGFSNPEGLTRSGNNLSQQSAASGEPIVGRPSTGTFGAIQAGSIELSTVDIASEFVKIITLQRGFQANSRIITTINQLLNEIIQLA